MRRVIVVALAAMLALPVVVTAGELAGVSMPDQVTVGGKTLQLNGMGLRKKMWVKVYVGGLYLAEKTRDAKQAIEAEGPKKVVMHFLTNKATKKKMDGAWDEGFEANAPEVPKDQVAQFKGFFGDMKKGDVVEITIVPGEGTHVSLNGTEKGVIGGDTFGKGILKVFIGPTPRPGDFKKGLLGG